MVEMVLAVPEAATPEPEADEAAEEAENEWGKPKPSIGGGGIGHDEDW